MGLLIIRYTEQLLLTADKETNKQTAAYSSFVSILSMNNISDDKTNNN